MLVIVAAMHATACATPRYFVVPSVSLDELYDDNLYYAIEDKQSDFITRVSPALEVGQESDTLSWSGRYRSEAEVYARETELNSAQVRQFADVEVEYLPTNRLALSAAAEYTETDTPSDLTIIPGSTIPEFLVGRAEANRTAVHSAGSYRLTALTTGSLAFTRAHEELDDVGESDTDALETWFDQRLSEVNTLSYGYKYRQYRFDQFQVAFQTAYLGESPLGRLLTVPRYAGLTWTRGATQYSDTPWIGLSHQFNARTRVAARVGPRLAESSVDPYVLVSLQHRFTQGEVLLDYQRDETTLLGEPRKQELEALYATISRRFGTRLDVHLIPGYAKVYEANYKTDIYSFGLGAAYKINEAVFLTASYDFNFQEVRAGSVELSEVSRNVIQVGVRFTYPRRDPDEPR